MLFCSQCGARIPKNSKFCYKCGAKAVMPEWMEDEEELEIPEEPAVKQPEDTAGILAGHDHAAHDHSVTVSEKTAETEKTQPVPEEAAPAPAQEKTEAAPAAEPEAAELAVPELSALRQDLKQLLAR